MPNPLQFIKEAQAELKKVVWPSRKETIRITLAVIILSLVVAAFLGLADLGLSRVVEFFVNR